MFNKISSIKLIAILAGLILIYVAIDYLGSNNRSKSFRETLVDIDTVKVTKIMLENKGETLELIKEADNWKVGIGNGKYADAQKNSVKGMLSSLLSVKPSRLVAKDPEKWKDYQVDSAGIRVTTFESDKKTLDLIAGRFGMQSQNSFYTFVRLAEDNEVYAADNFMAMSLQTDPSSYRNKQLISTLTDSIAEIQFNYPADSTFKMIKNGSIWFAAGQQIDSASAVGYLNNLRYVSSSKFVDDVPETALTNPVFNLTIVQNGQENIVVNVYQHSEYKWILSSGKNPHSYFADEAVFDKIFKNKDYFLKNK